jgi:hypothetical protein
MEKGKQGNQKKIARSELYVRKDEYKKSMG